MRKLFMIAALLVATTTFGQIAEGDAEWAKRAEGHEGGHAKAAHADAAIAAYQRAVAQNPNDLEARWKLLRAIRFKGAYVASTNDEKKSIYGGAKTAGEAAIAIGLDHADVRPLPRDADAVVNRRVIDDDNFVARLRGGFVK